MKFISEQFAKRHYLPSQVCYMEGEWWDALKKVIKDSFEWNVNSVTTCHRQMDISSIYGEVEDKGFPEGLYLKGTSKCGVQATVHEICVAIDNNNGEMPYPYAFCALQKLIEEGVVETVGDNVFRLKEWNDEPSRV